MPRGVSKPKKASQISIPPAESIKDRWDQIQGVQTGLCCLCEKRPIAPDSLIGLCRQCREAGRQLAAQQKATQRLEAVKAAMPQEGND